MCRGERAVLEVQPSYGFKHRDCKMQPPEGVKAEDPLRVDVQVGRQRPWVCASSTLLDVVFPHCGVPLIWLLPFSSHSLLLSLLCLLSLSFFLL